MWRSMKRLAKTFGLSLAALAALLSLGVPAPGQDDPEAKAVRLVEKLGGALTRDPKAKGNPVVGVNLSTKKAGDTELKELAGFTALQTLDLLFAPVTDAGIRELLRFPQLQTLNLGGTKITEAGITRLAGLKQLQVLGLGYIKISDAGAKALAAALPQLQRLNLEGSGLTNAGLKEL